MLTAISEEIAKVEAALGLRTRFRGNPASYFEILSRLDRILYRSDRSVVVGVAQMDVDPENQRVMVNLMVPKLGVSFVNGEFVCSAQWPRPDSVVTNGNIPYLRIPTWNHPKPTFERHTQNAILLYFEEVYCVTSTNIDRRTLNNQLQQLRIDSSRLKFTGTERFFTSESHSVFITQGDSPDTYVLVVRFKNSEDMDTYFETAPTGSVVKKPPSTEFLDQWASANSDCDVIIVCDKDLGLASENVILYPCPDNYNNIFEKMEDMNYKVIMYDRMSVMKIFVMSELLSHYQNVAAIDCMRNRPVTVPDSFWKASQRFGFICAEDFEIWLLISNETKKGELIVYLTNCIKRTIKREFKDIDNAIFQRINKLFTYDSESFKEYAATRVAETDKFLLDKNDDTVRFLPFVVPEKT